VWARPSVESDVHWVGIQSAETPMQGQTELFAFWPIPDVVARSDARSTSSRSLSRPY
jgi:hypothetical protein